jgi:hypothetical protein
MTLRSSRPALPLAAALLFALAASPAAAASSDAALLQSYAGNYTGRGELAANPPQTVRCRLSLQSVGSAKLNYTGRCSTGGAGISMSGVISVSNGRFTAAMSGTGGSGIGDISGTVAGKRRGNGVVFSSRQRDTSHGHDRDLASTLALTGGTIRIDFNIRDNKTGKTYAGSIPFTKGR